MKVISTWLNMSEFGPFFSGEMIFQFGEIRKLLFILLFSLLLTNTMIFQLKVCLFLMFLLSGLGETYTIIRI